MSDIDTGLLISETESAMKKAIAHLEAELLKIRAGKATPNMLDGIVVDYYGSNTPLTQVANISVMDARTLSVQPWEKNMLQPIERAIIASNIGINPQNDGVIIRLVVPPLTEERRRELVKKVKEEAERGRITVRNIRKDANEKIKRLKGESVSDDEIKTGEGEVQKITDAYIVKVDKHAELKEKDIMTI